MAVVQGSFSDLEERWFFVDNCSKIRHFFAVLGFCRHEGHYITYEEWFKREYAKLCPPEYPQLFNIKKDDET